LIDSRLEPEASTMLSGDDNSTLRGDDNKPARKSGQRKAKTEQGKKAEPRKRKSAQRQDPLPDQLLEAAEAIAAEVTPTETASIDTSATEGAPVAQVASVQGQNPLLDEVLEAAEAMTTEASEATTVELTSTGHTAVDTSPTTGTALVPVASGETDVVNYQTIANAYGNYARESLDQTRSFFEKLSGVRSLDKAFALQTEFARQAYDGFVAESQKIRELHGQLARQRLQRWEGLVARMIKPL
jgi:hypothetical protein